MVKSTLLTVSALAAIEVSQAIPLDAESLKTALQILIALVHGVISIVHLIKKNKKDQKKEG